MRKYVAVAFAVLLSLIFSGCKHKEQSHSSSVVTSIAPLASIAREIGGESFEYRYIVPLSSNPHTFEPTPGDMKAVESSSLFIYIGMRLDPWAEKMARYARNPLPLGDSLKSRGLDIANPHDIWLAPRTVRITARVITDALESLDSTKKDDFETRYHQFEARIDSMLAEFQPLRPDTVKIITYHAALAGALKQLGFNVVGVIANNPAQEPSLKKVNEIVSLCRREHVSIIVAESNFPADLPQKIARETGARLVTADPLYTGDYVSTIKDLMKKILAGQRA